MDYKQLIAEARAALEAGDLDQAEALLKKAKLAREADTMEMDDAEEKPGDYSRQTKAAGPAVYRLPMGGTPSTSGPASEQTAVKSWYVQRFGTFDAAAEQVLRELYGTRDYAGLTAAKMADMRRYLQHNVADPALERLILLSPRQISLAVQNGVPVNGPQSVKATMVEAQDALGGYAVPEVMTDEVISRLQGLTVVRGRAKATMISRDRLPILKRTGGDGRYIGNVRVSMVDESPTSSEAETNATFGVVNIPVHTAMAHTPMSMNLFEDSIVDVVSFLSEEIAAAYAIVEDDQFLVGSGVGMPQGVLNGTTGGPFDSDVATLNSGNPTALTADALIGLPWRIKGQYRQKKASVAWVMNSSTGEAISKLKDGQGRYLWSELNNPLASAVPDAMRGYGFAESEAMPSIAANTYPIVFGDWSGYRIIDRIGMSVKRYEDATTARQNQIVVVARRRYGGQVTDPWRFSVMKIAT